MVTDGDGGPGTAVGETHGGGGSGKVAAADGGGAGGAMGGGAKGGGIAKRVSPAGGGGSVPKSSDDSVDETKVSFDEGIGGGLKSSDEDGRIVLTAGLAI